MAALTDRLNGLLRMGRISRPSQVYRRVIPASARSPLRLAMLGTPRSGNTWLRRVLATAYAFGGESGWERSAHDPSEIDWGADPARSIVQIHLRRGPASEALLAAHGVRPIVPTRHPFDVLISILQYATHVHDTHLWLHGEGGDESAIRGLDPNHPTFLDYARGPRARALLAVSPEWLDATGAVRVRYEALVASPLPTLSRVATALGQAPLVDWETALAANTMDELRKTHGFGHIWKGQPGLWRLLLTRDSVEALADAHRPLLDALGEAADADADLGPDQALDRWRSLN